MVCEEKEGKEEREGAREVMLRRTGSMHSATSMLV